MTWQEALNWLIGGGAGAATYWLMEHVEGLMELSAEEKRYVSWLMPIGIACAAYVLEVVFGYVPEPVGGQGWVEALAPIVLLAVGVGQGLHGRLKLGR